MINSYTSNSFSLVEGMKLSLPRTNPPWEIKRETLVKNKDATDSRHGCKPEDRPAEDVIRYGVINLDKPAGPTSHEVAAWTKRILKLSSIGHGGTLEA
jgi:hypothetical protein